MILTKQMFLIGHEYPSTEIRERMNRSIVGEISM